ncbi:hypothetical protein ScPMuIL_015631 [Solemya velum]
MEASDLPACHKLGNAPRVDLANEQCADPGLYMGTQHSKHSVKTVPTPAHQQSGLISETCKRKEQEQQPTPESRSPKKPRLVFTDIQRRTLHAIFKETKRPSKEMQATIAQQLGLEVTTVANFFMNARRRSLDKWRDDDGNNNRESATPLGKS